MKNILLLIDRYGWAFHEIANAIAYHLSDHYHFTILAAQEEPDINASTYDFFHVFGGEQQYHLPFLKEDTKVIKGIYSHRWEVKGLSPAAFYAQDLSDAHAITVPSLLLKKALSSLPIPVHLFPEGVNTGSFTEAPPKSGPLRVGWAGNPQCTLKNVKMAKEAMEGFDMHIADGALSLREMVNFYNNIDVLLCSSTAEGAPRPVLEALSCGRFVVSFPVGIVPEVIRHKHNGLIVQERSVAALKKALHWCEEHVHNIRASQQETARHIRSLRSWEKTMPHIKDVYDSVEATHLKRVGATADRSVFV